MFKQLKSLELLTNKRALGVVLLGSSDHSLLVEHVFVGSSLDGNKVTSPLLKQADRSGSYRCKATSQVSWGFLP